MNPARVVDDVPVRTTVTESVLVVTLDRPEALNAIDPESNAALVDAWRRLRDDGRLRAAVLTGSGSRAFCAGIDLKRLGDFYAESHPGERHHRWAHQPGVGGLTRNFDPGKPIVAAVNGYCLGLGLELALACDIRLASPNAVFGLPEVRWGIIPGQGGTQRLPRAVPSNVAMEMILAGTTLTAARAYEVGLVNRVVPLRSLRAEARALARRIAGFPPQAVQRAREAVRRGLDVSLEDGLRIEQDLADPLRGSAESKAAVARFGHRPARRR